jgi:hypothetical protein
MSDIFKDGDVFTATQANRLLRQSANFAATSSEETDIVNTHAPTTANPLLVLRTDLDQFRLWKSVSGVTTFNMPRRESWSTPPRYPTPNQYGAPELLTVGKLVIITAGAVAIPGDAAATTDIFAGVPAVLAPGLNISAPASATRSGTYHAASAQIQRSGAVYIDWGLPPDGNPIWLFLPAITWIAA